MYHKRTEEDCTLEHEKTINNCIDDLVKNGEMQHDLARLLKPAQSRTPIFYTPLPRGCEACGKPKCSWCKEINETTTFTSSNSNKIFKIFHSVNCQSSWVIYIIECNICNLQYIGKSETAFNLRLNNHRNHIKKGISSCELTEHFLHNKRTHNFDNNFIITITLCN